MKILTIKVFGDSGWQEYSLGFEELATQVASLESAVEKLELKEGPAGKDGQDGLSAYEIACQYGFEGSEEEWLDSLHGKDGVDGIDGKDGSDGYNGKDGATPYIGDNGNWWIDGEDTGVSASGGSADLKDLTVWIEDIEEKHTHDIGLINGQLAELDKEFVTIDTEQVITGEKKFTQPIKNTFNQYRDGYSKFCGDGFLVVSDGPEDELFLELPYEEGIIATREYVDEQLKSFDPGVSGGGDVTSAEFEELSKRVDDLELKDEELYRMASNAESVAYNAETSAKEAQFSAEDALALAEKNADAIVDLDKRIDNIGGGSGEVTQAEFDKVVETVQDHEDRITKLEDSSGGSGGSVFETGITIRDFYMTDNFTRAQYYGDGIHALPDMYGYGSDESLWLEFPNRYGEEVIATEQYVQEQLKNLDPGMGGGEVTQEEFDKLSNEVSDISNRVADIEKTIENGGGSSGGNPTSTEAAGSDIFERTTLYADGLDVYTTDGENHFLEFPASGYGVIATEEYVQEQLKNIDPGVSGGGEVTAEEFDKLEKMVDEVYHNYTHISEHTALEDRVGKLEDNVSAPTTKEPYGSDMYYSATLWADGIEVAPADDEPAFLEFPLYESGTIATQKYVQEEIKKSLDNGIGGGGSGEVTQAEFDYLEERVSVFENNVGVNASAYHMLLDYDSKIGNTDYSYGRGKIRFTVYGDFSKTDLANLPLETLEDYGRTGIMIPATGWFICDDKDVCLVTGIRLSLDRFEVEVLSQSQLWETSIELEPKEAYLSVDGEQRLTELLS